MTTPPITEQIQVQVRFTVDDPDNGSFSDALYYSLEDYAVLSEEDKTAAEVERYEGWLISINPPPPPLQEPDLVAMQAELDTQNGVSDELNAVMTNQEISFDGQTMQWVVDQITAMQSVVDDLNGQMAVLDAQTGFDPADLATIPTQTDTLAQSIGPLQTRSQAIIDANP